MYNLATCTCTWVTRAPLLPNDEECLFEDSQSFSFVNFIFCRRFLVKMLLSVFWKNVFAWNKMKANYKCRCLSVTMLYKSLRYSVYHDSKEIVTSLCLCNQHYRLEIKLYNGRRDSRAARQL